MNEFSHFVASDAIGRSGPLTLVADGPAKTALAVRLNLERVHEFAVSATLESSTEGARLKGSVTARVSQLCAATGLPLESRITAPFDLRYVRDWHEPADADAELELGDADCDVLPFDNGGIDVGEAAVQTLALALDPYPRHPDADRILKERGVLSEGAAGPFAALAALKRP